MSLVKIKSVVVNTDLKELSMEDLIELKDQARADLAYEEIFEGRDSEIKRLKKLIADCVEELLGRTDA